jgi:hypothetical protein
MLWSRIQQTILHINQIFTLRIPTILSLVFFHTGIDKWFDDDYTDDPSTSVKLSLVKIICEEFSHQVPSGRFLIRVGKGTDQETILEMTDDEIYSKTHKHMVNLRNALKSEYILWFWISYSVKVALTLIDISFLVPPKDRIIPSTEFLEHAAICVQVDISEDILNDNDTINQYLLERTGFFWVRKLMKIG